MLLRWIVEYTPPIWNQSNIYTIKISESSDWPRTNVLILSSATVIVLLQHYDFRWGVQVWRCNLAITVQRFQHILSCMHTCTDFRADHVLQVWARGKYTFRSHAASAIGLINTGCYLLMLAMYSTCETEGKRLCLQTLWWWPALCLADVWLTAAGKSAADGDVLLGVSL